MTKERIDVGVYQYSLDSLEEAKQDADNAATRETQYVLEDEKGNYYGPVNEAKHGTMPYSRLDIAYTADPDAENHEYRERCQCSKCRDQRYGGGNDD